MIKVKTTRDGEVLIKMNGEALDIAEELLNVTINIVEMLVEKGKLPKELVNDFIDDFAQQVKDNIEINN